MLNKLDENLPPDASALLNNNGHDALTIWDQGLQGRPDAQIASVCQEERRTLMTLDLDFADIRTYPANQYSGVITLIPLIMTSLSSSRLPHQADSSTSTRR